MRVIRSEQMQQIEEQSFLHGQSAETLMQEAALGIAQVLETKEEKFVLLCGRGNNAGDAYLAGKILLEKGLHLQALQMPGSLSPLCQKQQKAFVQAGGKVLNIEKKEDLCFPFAIVDALFGTGFRGSAEGLFAQAIHAANASEQRIYSIDIPSGLNGNDGSFLGSVIQAKLTLSLGFPKLGLFLGAAWDFVGDFVHIPLQLKNANIGQESLPLFLLEQGTCRLPKIRKSRHKYQAGYVACIAGSPGMGGAAILSAYAAYRMGAGMVRLFHPKSMEQELAASPYEIVKEAHTCPKLHKGLQKAFERCSSVLLGPGLGRDFSTALFVERLLKLCHKKIIIDADGLYALARRDLCPPKGSILSPHLGEASYLLGQKIYISEKVLQDCLNYCLKHQCLLILKSAPVFVFLPSGKIYVHTGGNPGMATAGSGDVLSGIIAALLATDLSMEEAAITGLQLHASAGDLAALALGQHSLMANDLIDYLAIAMQEA